VEDAVGPDATGDGGEGIPAGHPGTDDASAVAAATAADSSTAPVPAVATAYHRL